MDFWINVLMRWVHVAAAVVGVGATVAMRFIVLPALARLPNGGEVLDTIRPTLKRVIHSALGVLLLTGLYNFVLVAIPTIKALKEANPNAMAGYHAVMGVKILLSLVLFVIAVLLLKPVPSFHEN